MNIDEIFKKKVENIIKIQKKVKSIFLKAFLLIK